MKTLSMFARTAALVALVAAPVATLNATPPAAKPVTVGIDGPEYDACGSLGEVRGLREDGDNFLSVRAAPAATAAETDRLKNGTTVMLCDSSKDGKWSGVVYPAPGQTVSDCAASSPVRTQIAYSGPCKSGWVASTFVGVTAG